MIFDKFFERKFALPDGNFEIKGVPFFSQRLNEDNFQNEGFANLDEAKHWSERICALACLKMILKKNFHDRGFPLAELLKKGKEIRAYREDVGWLHQGIADLSTKYGLYAKRESIGSNLEKLGQHILHNELVIASVSVGFEAGKEYPEEDGSIYIVPRGGHLVVVFGAEVKNGEIKKLKLHHPSSEKEYEWPNFEIDRTDFLKSFSKDGNIIIFRKNDR